MLQVFNLAKEYGLTSLFSDLSFILNEGERTGLVGPNGCGKTTLLRIIAGLERADKGHFHFIPKNTTVGYLPQALEFAEDETVAEVLAQGYPDYLQAQADMVRLAAQMTAAAPTDDLTRLTERYAEAEAHFEAAGGYALEPRLRLVLAGLDLDQVRHTLPVAHLSGGQKTRLGLAKLLIQQPRLLLLDEPTNHLDIDALAWLAEWLQTYEGAVLIVSHDRAFLDETTTRTLVLDPLTQTLRDAPGNYTFYLETIAREVDQQQRAYQAQQEKIARLRGTAHHLRGQAKFRKGGKADSNDRFVKGFYANRSAATIGRAKQVERRIAQLQNEDQVEKPGQQWQLKVDFADDKSGARQVLSLENVAMAFDSHVLFRNVSLTLTHGERIALIGPNGEGKTTLLRLITGELPPSAGKVHLGKGVKFGYLAQEQEVLDSESTPYDTLQEILGPQGMDQGEVRRFLHQFLFAGDDVFIKIGHLSLGERVRLMLARLVAQACNFLVMDEPINHLDIPSRERFEQALAQFPGTILVVAHDRAFIGRVATGIWEMRDGGVKQTWGVED